VDDIHLCGRVLVLATGGRVAFFGRPQEQGPGKVAISGS